MRVKSKWYNKDKTHTVEEIGAAVAFIAVRIAQNSLLELENNDFQTDTHAQRLGIMEEILCFTVHLADRMTIEKFDEEERVGFITELANKSAKHIQDNKRDLIGPGEYKQDFIDTLNKRLEDYSDFQFEDGASFPMRRFFGDLVTEQMGEKNKRWVSDQIIDIESHDIYATLKRSMANLFAD